MASMPLIPHEDLKPWQFLAYDLTLDLTTVAREPIDRARNASAGIEVVSLAALIDADPSAAERVYSLHTECYRLQPPADAHEEPIPYHLWRWGSIEARGEALPDAYFVAVVDGDFAGLSTVVQLPRLPGVLQSRFTGVLPAHRGSGIARRLKAETIAYAVDNGYRELRATVLAANTAMLHIDEAFGFQRRREYVIAYPHLTVEKRYTA
jgi:GNAT superfamily N-acetyltransferase